MSGTADDLHVLHGDALTLAVRAMGAEPCSLRDAAGRELLWDAGPAWPRHAPVLFPIVGRLRDDTLRHRGREYRLTQHGFARDRRFAWAERTADGCRLVLEADAGTRACYPFEFRLEIGYALRGATLEVGYAVTNTGAEPLPASLGAHPAFRWPLTDGTAKDAHVLEFGEAEPDPVRRLAHGLLRARPEPTPVQGRTLALNEALFADDALILDRPRSSSLRYLAPDGRGVSLSWHGFGQLGLWSKPDGADFLCIEPWHGTASPEGFDGEFMDKPGLMLIPPGESRRAGWQVRTAQHPGGAR